jgi:Raf kinase inhibitor-like YbhB/YbcL family protein
MLRNIKSSAVLGGAALIALAIAAPTPAEAAASKLKKLTVTVDNFKSNATIPGEYAFCVPDPAKHTTSGANKNPDIKWSAGPDGTKSYAIIVVDTSVPTVFDDANKEGKTISAKMKRQNFYHMILVDIPPTVTELPEGADANGITPKGKPIGQTPNGVRGANDYGGFMKDGDYGGYDGPCPPWNDEKLHRYHFRVYALDVPSLGLQGKFGGKQAMAAIGKHALARGEVVGIYTQNPALAKKKSG